VKRKVFHEGSGLTAPKETLQFQCFFEGRELHDEIRLADVHFPQDEIAVLQLQVSNHIEKSFCVGPGLLQEQQSGTETVFVIQCRDRHAKNRILSRRDVVISLLQKSIKLDAEQSFQELPFEIVNSTYGLVQVKYTADEGEVLLQVERIDKYGVSRRIRGSPFNPTFTTMAKNRANECMGPLIYTWVTSTLRYQQEFCETIKAGLHGETGEGDALGLTKVISSIEQLRKQDDALGLQQEQLLEILTIFELEGIPCDKQRKQLGKLVVSLAQLKEDAIIKESTCAQARGTFP